MKIYVKNNNVIKAYKLLNRKLQDDGFYKDLQLRFYFKSKGQKKREARAIAVLRNRKREKKAEELREKIEAKQRYFNKKQQQQYKKRK
jgi:small subunit ribosomal protein S21